MPPTGSRRRGVVAVFSDLFDEPAEVLAGLKHLKYQRHDVVVFHVLDGAEVEFPFRQSTLFHGLEQLPDLLTDPVGVRDGYLREFNAFRKELQTGCRLHQIDYVELRTDKDLGLALAGVPGQAGKPHVVVQSNRCKSLRVVTTDGLSRLAERDLIGDPESNHVRIPKSGDHRMKRLVFVALALGTDWLRAEQDRSGPVAGRTSSPNPGTARRSSRRKAPIRGANRTRPKWKRATSTINLTVRSNGPDRLPLNKMTSSPSGLSSTRR